MTMTKLTTLLSLCAVLLLANISHGFTAPAVTKNNCRRDTRLTFKRTEDVPSPRVDPTYKVTKLQFDDGLEREKTSKRKTLAANIRGKAMDLLLKSYEIDQLEYGL